MRRVVQPIVLPVILSLGLLLAASVALGQSSAPAPKPGSRAAEDAHRKEDISKHRQMARAHEDAARCLEGGEKESVCQERLQAACKGIAVGRYCGMRHAH
jgi:hypothetical protein